MQANGNLQHRICDEIDAFCTSFPSSIRAELAALLGFDLLSPTRGALFAALLRERRGDHPTPTGRLSKISRGLMRLKETAWMARPQDRHPDAVLFLPRELNHVKQHHAVAPALRAQGIPVRHLACHPKPAAMLRRLNEPFSYAPVDFPGFGARSTQAQSIAGQVARLLGDEDSSHAIRQPAYAVLKREAASAYAYSRYVIDNLRTQTPRCMVVGNDLTTEGAIAVQVGQQMGVPSVCMMHGASGTPNHRWHTSDRLLCYGPESVAEFQELNVVTSELVATGAPHLDARPHPSPDNHPDIERKLGLGDKPWILVATSGAGHQVSLQHHIALITVLGRTLDHERTPTLVFKLHPKDKLAHYEAIHAHPKVHVVEHGASGYPSHIFDWLQGPKAVLTTGSTVALEAMLMEVPVITVDLQQELEHVGFIRQGATHHATKESDVATLIQSLALVPPSNVRGVLDQTFSYWSDRTAVPHTVAAIV